VGQPSRVNGDDDDEEWESQQQMHSLQDLDDLAVRTAVEVIDVKDDAIHRLLVVFV
jgi:hypothetical protein